MLDVRPVPAFQDNYIWLAVEPSGRGAAIVDPGDAEPVLAALKAQALDPKAILITHHHRDHTGGIRDLRRAYPDLPVYGPAAESIPLIDHPLAEGDRVALPELGFEFEILDIPGHTAGHIAYVGHGVLFCGDTIFSVGCGRVFEGTMAQMQASLAKLRALPADTRICCAHEYTLANIGFANWVEPDNPALQAREQQARAQRDAGRPTLPVTLGEEIQTNPFLRWDQAPVRAAAAAHAGHGLTTDADVFAAVRAWKDNEYD